MGNGNRIVTFHIQREQKNGQLYSNEFRKFKIFSHLNELRGKNEYVYRQSKMIKTNSFKTIKIYWEIVLCNKHLNEYIQNYRVV